MPFALFLLGVAVFAQGTSEFMLSGLVPDIARDLQVSVPAAGALTSAFAVGMVVGAPLMAGLARRWSRRGALLGFLLVFLGVHVVGAVTDSFGVLLATRVVGALANAGFLAVALVAAVGMVEPDAKGRATSMLLGGVTLACVVGVPAGALLGQFWGWRSAFWAVAVVSVPAVVAVARSVPGGAAESVRPSLRGELRSLRSPRLLVTLLLGALVNGATFCSFTYLAPLATNVTGLDGGWVPVVLALFGFGAFVGVRVGGRYADRRPVLVVGAGGLVLCAGWSGFALGAGEPVVALGLVPVLGALSFGVGSTLISQVLYAAPGAPTLAGGFATAAFNVGAAFGPWLGGTAIGAGGGYRSPLWVSAGLVALSLVMASGAAGVRRTRARKKRGADQGRTPASWSA
ncbi:Cmx/CmrA family chloramphenicol efflux MFS transporter [Streptomyces sp. NL15-2K]|uniref:Cmx/CmrA family chloramphenicol efflux MFS transporter n=1 Tax=Streptomyces sp. NL15-2K TaxID=376149 RepID=UPI000F56F785|nr:MULTISPECIES: Cmx/CmrA family chloramphenicol efflux MFS transporter [Actinomycetes]WKX12900.1 MFS transporter [Kutzneria buriramensis]GCB45789.1 chloramphenicol resistance protein [Streptomyces sp. NL15-2K]